MHGVGHAMLALAAGLLVRGAMASGPTARDPFAFALGNWRGNAGESALLVSTLSLSLVGLVCAFVKGLGAVGATYLVTDMSGEVGHLLRLRMFDGWIASHVLRPLRQADHGAATSLAVPAADAQMDDGATPRAMRGVAAMTDHVRAIEEGLSRGLFGSVRAGIQLIVVGVLMMVLDPLLLGVAIGIFVPFAVLLGGVRRRVRRAIATEARGTDALFAAANDAVLHVDLWTTFGAERRIRDILASAGRRVGKVRARVDAYGVAISSANEVLAAGAIVCGVLIASVFARGTAPWISVMGFHSQNLLPFVALFFTSYRPIRDLGEARVFFARGESAYAHVREWGDMQPRDTCVRDEQDGSADGPAAASRAAKGAWTLETLDVRDMILFRGDTEAVSFCVRPGEVVAIVGATGVGKTTLLRTLLGLDAAVSGEVRFGDLDLSQAPAGPRYRPFAWMPQGAPLVAAALEANVGLGGSDEAGLRALDDLGGTRLREELSASLLGEHDRAVSGGERQWISLARAVASSQPVLLLDEPTSGLDELSQRRVLEAIDRLRGKRSIVIVTHREEPLAIADRVVRLSGRSVANARSTRDVQS